jgi:segregation and condensation protein B
MDERHDDREQRIGDALTSAVGAVVFASDEPVPLDDLAQAFGVAPAEVEAAVRDLERHYAQHDVGLRLEHVAGGVRVATRSEVGSWVRTFFRQRNRTRLSLPALETLAIVAYRQPVTAPEIQAIRGKDPTAALKGLLDKKLIRCLGHKKVVGSPLLYGTSKEFLTHFGLNGLDDLPSIEEFDQFLEGLVEQGTVTSVSAEENAPLALALDAPGEIGVDDA